MFYVCIEYYYFYCLKVKCVFKMFVPSNQCVDDRSSQTYQIAALNKNFLLVDPTMYDNYYEKKLFFCTRIAKYIHIYQHFIASDLF